MDRQAQSRCDRQINTYKRAIKNCLLVYLNGFPTLCFEYKKSLFVAEGETLTSIFLYEKDKQPHFTPASYIIEDELFSEVLQFKFYHSLEDGNTIDGDLGAEEYATISKTRKPFIEVIETLKEYGFAQFT